ncbi:MAG: hypothetical protein AAF456_14155 [Planctomycetota bacterium]
MKNLIYGLAILLVSGLPCATANAQTVPASGFKMRDVEPEVVREIFGYVFSPDSGPISAGNPGTYGFWIPEIVTIAPKGIMEIARIIQMGQGISGLSGVPPQPGTPGYDLGYLTPFYSRPINDADNRPPLNTGR